MAEEKKFTTIKTRFGNLQLVGSDTVIQVTLQQAKNEEALHSNTPLVTTLKQSQDKATLTATSVPLINIIKPVIIDRSMEETVPDTLIENVALTKNNKLAIDISKLVNMPLNIPIATEQKIGGVRSIDPTELPLLNSIKVHTEPVTVKRVDGTEVVNVAPGWMEVNSLDVEKLQQTNWLILDSEDADGNFTATTEAK